MIAEGKPAPEFTLPDQSGKPVSLSDLRGQRVVLYFYPRDNTPGCTKEACSFRDNLGNLKKQGVVVIGISPDSSASHQKFAAKHNLEFTLLADTDRKVSEAYGVFKEKTLYGRLLKGIERTTFLIDEQGVIRKIFPRVRVNGHVEKVQAAIDALDA